jgi:hypothetical protein
MKRIRKGYSRNESISPKIIKAEKHQNLNAKFRCSILTKQQNKKIKLPTYLYQQKHGNPYQLGIFQDLNI